jgi:serine protease Do
VNLNLLVRFGICGAVLATAHFVAPRAAVAQDILAVREEAAFRAAAAEAAPSVVAIETIGGLDTVGEVLVGTGPSSGLIVTTDGYIASSSFNFAHKPASIIVSTADGKRLPAKLVARDEARNWVLLKIDAPQSLPIPRPAPEAEIAVGQWVVAVGRTFDAAAPNLSVGIISALHRIWGKAMQTDAKISSANYGGALVDLQGRVAGLLVPLSPNARGEAAGVEWYDSGIGFAVPLEHVMKVLPRMIAGENLKPGLAGVAFRGVNVYADPPVISKCRAGSPAYEAGFRPGDRVTIIDGRPVAVQSQVMELIQSRYAGDVLQVTVARGTENLERELKLVEKIEPYRRPFFGILTERDVEPGAGVRVRYVYPKSPAATAGLRVGDVITTIQGMQVRTRDELRSVAADVELGKKATFEFRRDGSKQSVELEAIGEPEDLPKDLPTPSSADAAELPAAVRIKLPEFPNGVDLYVPPQYDDAAAHGMAVLAHPHGGFPDKTVVQRWRERCREMNWLLLVPHTQKENWTPQDVELVRKAMERSAESYRVDPARTAFIGYEEGGLFAIQAAARLRDRIRSVVVFNAPVPGFPAENEPGYPLTIFIAAARDFAGAARLAAPIEQMRKMFLPVVQQTLPAKAGDWDDKSASELLRRLDALDRI